MFTSVVAVLQSADEAVSVGGARCVLDPLQRAVRQSVGDIVSDGGGEEHRVLVHHGNLWKTALCSSQLKLKVFHTLKGNPSGLGIRSCSFAGLSNFPNQLKRLEYNKKQLYSTFNRSLKRCINDLLVEEAVLVGVQWFVVQSDLAILRLVEALEETHTGAFTFSGHPHQRRHLTRLQLQRKVLKQGEKSAAEVWKRR